MNPTAQDDAPPRISSMGTSALLFEAAGDFELRVQRRIWALQDEVTGWADVREAVVGVTNLLIVWRRAPRALEAAIEALREAWARVQPKDVSGRIHEIPVHYGGAAALDFDRVLQHTGLSAQRVVELHSGGLYTVCAVGAAPGFGYLHGLDPRLACPRKAVPAMRVAEGAVSIGGMQTGVSSMTGPSGWNVIGTSAARMFDLARRPPGLLAPGDQIRFVAGAEPGP